MVAKLRDMLVDIRINGRMVTVIRGVYIDYEAAVLHAGFAVDEKRIYTVVYDTPNHESGSLCPPHPDNVVIIAREGLVLSVVDTGAA